MDTLGRQTVIAQMALMETQPQVEGFRTCTPQKASLLLSSPLLHGLKRRSYSESAEPLSIVCSGVQRCRKSLDSAIESLQTATALMQAEAIEIALRTLIEIAQSREVDTDIRINACREIFKHCGFASRVEIVDD